MEKSNSADGWGVHNGIARLRRRREGLPLRKDNIECRKTFDQHGINVTKEYTDAIQKLMSTRVTAVSRISGWKNVCSLETTSCPRDFSGHRHVSKKRCRGCRYLCALAVRPRNIVSLTNQPCTTIFTR